MFRLKRWLNMNRERVNEDGSLKTEYLQELIDKNRPPELISKHAKILKDKYESLKHLDETDPEPWPVYTAYDFFTEEEKQQFNPDGSLKPKYVEQALQKGITENWLEEMERRKKIDVDNYNAVSVKYAAQGINFGKQEMNRRIASSRTYGQRLKQMAIDLRNCEPADSLPFDKETRYW
ncbi:hypothetical protein PN456_17055 [Nodularia spumigena CS-586/05]|uniref:hypothetical protein n=1 Tax=Nodularia spumigena TaxID=70799 RepID=UPI00232F472B|nr:hypothetical protein [Nodularia spumigena]MDB9370636.1 hypothetical protein [Nodularia spumigena CS-586/05]